MLNIITETLLSMIHAVPWHKVVRLFVIIVLAILAVGLIFGSLFWSVYITSFWPLLLLIPAAFIVSMFAAVCE